MQVRGAVVDADLESAAEREIGHLRVGLDAVRVEARARERGEQRTVAALDQRDPTRAAVQRLRDRVLPRQVVASRRDPGADGAGARDVGGEVFELGDASAEQPQRSVDRGGESGDLLRDPDVVPADQLRHDPLDHAEDRAVRGERDHRVDDDEVFGALERGVEVVAHLGRREPIEHLVELALEARRIFPRGAAGPHLGFDLGGKFVDVDVVVRQD